MDIVLGGYSIKRHEKKGAELIQMSQWTICVVGRVVMLKSSLHVKFHQWQTTDSFLKFYFLMKLMDLIHMPSKQGT